MVFVGSFRPPFRPVFIMIGLAAAARLSPGATPSAQEIVRKSVEAIQWDWSEASKYSYVESDVATKHGDTRTSKTYRVLMIDGSPYQDITSIDGRPLSPQAKLLEQQKLEKEIQARRNESDRERRRRMDKYLKGNERNHQMLKEMIDAFQFRLAGETRVDGHDCWLLDAEPKPGYYPADHEGRVLKGMKGQLWIDKATNQWVKVQAQVVKPVSFYGFLAKVGPGTEFYLKQEPAPLGNGFWLPKVFNVQVKATALGFFNEDSTEYETYSDYQPMPQAIALLQSSK